MPGRRREKDHHNAFDKALDKAADKAVEEGLAGIPLSMTLEVDVTENPGQISEYRVILRPRG